MRRSYSIAILALCFAVSLAPWIAAQEASAPRAVVKEAVKDLGTVGKGGKVRHEFVIRNEGKAPLNIKEVRPACGCTVAEFDKVVAPGGEGSVRVELDTTALTGPSSKSVVVYTDDPENPTLNLTVKVDARPYITMVPGYARYNTVQGEQEGTVRQVLWSENDKEFEITRVEAPPYVHTTFRKAKEDEGHDQGRGQQWVVETTLDSMAPVGALTEYVSIHTTHPDQPVVKLPLSGFVRPVLAVTPPVADFKDIEIKEPIEANLVVKNYATEGIQLTKVESDLAGVAAEIVPIDEGRHYQVRLTLSPSMPKGEFDGMLKIRTDSERAPVLEVPLKGRVI